MKVSSCSSYPAGSWNQPYNVKAGYLHSVWFTEPEFVLQMWIQVRPSNNPTLVFMTVIHPFTCAYSLIPLGLAGLRYLNVCGSEVGPGGKGVIYTELSPQEQRSESLALNLKV